MSCKYIEIRKSEFETKYLLKCNPTYPKNSQRFCISCRKVLYKPSSSIPGQISPIYSGFKLLINQHRVLNRFWTVFSFWSIFIFYITVRKGLLLLKIYFEKKKCKTRINTRIVKTHLYLDPVWLFFFTIM